MFSDAVANELDVRLRADLRKHGDFARVHPVPRSGADVPDDRDARLVVLPAEHPCSKEPGNAAETAAQAILESRGSAPRLYRNTLVFLAADRVRLQDLDEALRKHLAWQSILAEKDVLNLDPHQVRQAETQAKAAESTVAARLPDLPVAARAGAGEPRRRRSRGRRRGSPPPTRSRCGPARRSAATNCS